MSTDSPNYLQVADLILDLETNTLTQNGKQVDITKKELKILYLLATKPSKVQSREVIFEYAWEADILVGSRTIDVHIRRLRSKIGAHYIKTIKGVGYQFQEI